ncbi:hypothetical protein GYM62_13865 [Algoriphagus sp. NBT04N3]|uniref:hypothetical protein n=1 Tax=Algoriphagus sp. NBT04N3 TaxID=2705473 RepID=UPI001C6312DD|nr:hypothetical protein [Algoriphagus sp. NBT04N3]QYH39814.1 hypothetical protein GYM62_13865 [Algoriphagus sp. NBT04N3]
MSNYRIILFAFFASILSVHAGIAGFLGGAISGALVGGTYLAIQKAIECSK